MRTVGEIQSFIGVKADGEWGPKSQAALDAIIHPKPTQNTGWEHITLRVEGEDIFLDNVLVTAFGGASDAVDGVFQGQTASGKVNTTKQPDFLGCALPMNREASPALRGSPIPKLPWMTRVQFTDPIERATIVTELIDEGPAKKTKKGADLTVAAAKFFDKKATANNFSKRLNVRIIGGAKYLS